MAPFTPAVKLTPPTVTVLPASRSVNVTAAVSFFFCCPEVGACDDPLVNKNLPDAGLVAVAVFHADVLVPENVPVDPAVPDCQ